MSSWSLFRMRLSQDFKYQVKVVGTVIDWVIALYFFVPALIFIPLFYNDLWRNTGDYWLEITPFPVLFGILLLFTLFSHIRTFMMEADLLFLMERKTLYEGLRKWASAYSLVQLIFIKGVLLLAVSPILVQIYEFGWKEIFFLYCFLLGFELMINTVKKGVSRPFIRWGGVILPLWILTVTLGTVFSIQQFGRFGMTLFILLCFWYGFRLVPSKRYFFREAAFESKHRLRYVKFIMNMSNEVPKPPRRLGKRPLFIRNGQRIFKTQSPENGLLELLLKGFVRHSVYLSSYVRLITLTLFAILMLPIWVKWTVFIAFFLFLQYNNWLKGLFEKLLDEDFFQVVPFDERLREIIWLRFKRILMIPAIALNGMVTVILTIFLIL